MNDTIEKQVARLGDFSTQEVAKKILQNADDATILGLIDYFHVDNQIAQAALVELVASRGATSVESLLDALESDNQTMIGNTISVLTMIGEPAMRPLIERIAAADPSAAGNYLQAASRFGTHIGPTIESVIENTTSPSDTLIALLLATKPDSIAEYENKIFDILGSPDQASVAVASEALRRSGEMAIPLLSRAIGEINPYIQQNATNTFIAMGRIAVPELVECLGDYNQLVQQNAMRALTAIGEPAVDTLNDVLEDGNDLQRQNAAAVLRSIGRTRKGGSFLSRFRR